MLQCFKSWGTQLIGKEPDRWHVNEYATVDLPDPNAKPIEKAREMRRQGEDIQQIATALDFNISTISRWCKGIKSPPKNADKIAKARKMEKQGFKRKEIADKLAVNPKTITRWLSKKGT